MLTQDIDIDTDLGEALLSAARDALRQIPPAFPLDATVAVNPFLGQTGEDLATASARLARVAGVPLTPPRAVHRAALAAGEITDADLDAALAAAAGGVHLPADLATLKRALDRDAPPPRALPSLAVLAADETGIDWPSLIEKTFGLWASGYFDRGQALWSPAPGQGAYAAWRAWASHDLTPEIAGLSGFCAHVAAAPDTARRAILRAAERLGLDADSAPGVFHRLLAGLGGWAMHARWLLWQAELTGGADETLAELLAIRLVWEEALIAHLPGLAGQWAEVRAIHAEPVEPNADQVLDAILQDAAERAHQRRLVAALAGSRDTAPDAPVLQAAFCIDVRSEPIRRALEAQAGGIETVGFAGFFGLPLAHRDAGSDVVEAHLPVLLNPAMQSSGQGDKRSEAGLRIAARTRRAWGRFRQAAVSSFAFVEAAGPLYGLKLVKDALGAGHASAPAPVPHFLTEMSAQDKAATGATVLKAMSMTDRFAPLVLLLGHGAQVTNNPHESAYHCGACGGHTGEVSARLLALLLNDPETRAGLAAHGVEVPEGTRFVAGLHDTTTDEITLYEDGAPASEALSRAKGWIAAASRDARVARAPRLPGATPESIAARAANWAETRPEWGLAGCAAFIAAPRAATAGADLGGRAFLHSYDWRADEGFGVLELILTAPVVVASWISLQYYGSSVAPEMFGGGNKLIHNVTGGIGVVEGNGGRLRAGLPLQAVHDGARLVHDPLRLSVMIEAPEAAITKILADHDGLRALFDNGWMHLFRLEGGRVAARYRPGLAWEQAERAALAA